MLGDNINDLNAITTVNGKEENRLTIWTVPLPMALFYLLFNNYYGIDSNNSVNIIQVDENMETIILFFVLLHFPRFNKTIIFNEFKTIKIEFNNSG